MRYKVLFASAEAKGDAENLEFALNEWFEDGYELISITSKVVDGDTVGYLITFGTTNVK